MADSDREDLMESEPVEERDLAPSGVTWRAVVLGLSFVAGFGFLIPYLQDLKGGADLSLGPINSASILALLILLGPVNGLLRWRWKRACLGRKEVLTVYAMVAVTAAIAGVGYATWVNIMVTASHYLATPENRWGELIQPHIPTWMQLNDAMAVRWLWEQIPENQPMPWWAWQRPLLLWGFVALCIYAGSFSLISLVRRDWIEGQRLVFPLAQIPLEMVGQLEAARVPLLRHPAFLVGFAAAFLYGVVGMLHTYYPAVPYHSLWWALGTSINPSDIPWGPLHQLRFNVSIPAVGIMCLVPAEVSLSFWVFNLLHFASLVVFAALGMAGQETARYGFDPRAFLSFQAGGALAGFGVFVLWQSRRAVLAALRSWWDPKYRDDDPLELLRPRYALLGLLVSTIGLALVARAAGAQVHRLLLLLFLFYMTALTLTRVIAAAGTSHVECGPQIRYLLDYGLGTFGVKPGTYVLLNQMDAIFMTEFKVSFMHYAANDTKIFHASRLRGTSVVLAIAVAVVTMLVVASTSRVYTNYHLGIASLGSWWVDEVPRWEWGDMVEGLQSPRGRDYVGIAAMVSGGVIATALGLLHLNVWWWRLSPVGFLSPQNGLNWYIWANAFLAWLVVSLLFRLGGLRLYRRVRPAFFGLFLGGVTSMLLSNGVLLITGGQVGYV